MSVYREQGAGIAARTETLEVVAKAARAWLTVWRNLTVYTYAEIDAVEQALLRLDGKPVEMWACGICGRQASDPGKKVSRPAFWYEFDGVLHCIECGWGKTEAGKRGELPPWKVPRRGHG